MALLNQKTLSAKGNRQGWILGEISSPEVRGQFQKLSCPVYSLEIALTLGGPASIMGITSLDKAVYNVSRIHGKVKEELTVTKRLMAWAHKVEEAL